MNIIEHAKRLLIEGKLVAIPTETVYGLGADARNPAAVQKIYAAKGRPATNPLIIHIPNVDAIRDWAIEIPDTAWQLARAFWPGPLTLILKKHPNVSLAVTGGQETIALRVPNHPLTLALLAEFKGGIAAPSANRSGKISPTTAAHVRAELGTAVDYILDGGSCTLGIESTILSLLEPIPVILRQGSISASALQEILGDRVRQVGELEDPTLSTPGSELSHYAPSQPLYLFDQNALLEKVKALSDQNISFSVMSFTEKPSEIKIPTEQWILGSTNAERYAQQLYANLHDLDKIKTECILVESPPNTEPWFAIKDRLRRAAHPTK